MVFRLLVELAIWQGVEQLADDSSGFTMISSSLVILSLVILGWSSVCKCCVERVLQWVRC